MKTMVEPGQEEKTKKRKQNTYSNIIPPADPTAETLRPFTGTKPGSPFTFGNTSFEERTQEQNGCEQQTSENICQIDGPPAH